MPIGTITPGNFITVTADIITGLPSAYTFTPSPTMAILSANMQSLTLQMATNDKYLDDYKVDVRGDTMSGDLSIPSNTITAKYVEFTHGLTATGAAATNVATLACDTIQIGASSVSATDLRGTQTAAADGLVILAGRKRLWRPRVALPDAASKTIGVYSGTGVDYSGDNFALPGTTAFATGTPLQIILKSTGTGTTPGATERLKFSLRILPGALNERDGADICFEFKREGGARIAYFVDDPAVDSNMEPDIHWIEFEFISGQWEVAYTSGFVWDETNTAQIGFRVD